MLTVDAGSTLDLNNTTIIGGTLSNEGTVDSTGTSAISGVTVTAVPPLAVCPVHARAATAPIRWCRRTQEAVITHGERGFQIDLRLPNAN